jgi:RluA family pseudouridine synthase
MKRYHTRVPSALRKIRLDHFLTDWLPRALGVPVGRSMLRSLFLAGGVYVNRHCEKRAVAEVYAGAVIEVYVDLDRMLKKSVPQLEEVSIDPDSVVFEDEWLIVINKPSGIPSQPTMDPRRANLFDLMKKFLSERDGVGAPYVGLHHRLDKDTSGLILFTKKEEANKGVSELFSQHQIRKTYQCISWREPGSKPLERGSEFEITNYLGKVSESEGKKKYGEVKSGGDLAQTRFTAIQVFREMVWLRAMPLTGRTHQIRVHCSGARLPILGDPMYFPENILPMIQVPRLLLHAAELDFTHPVTGKKIWMDCPLPEEFVSTLTQGRT